MDVLTSTLIRFPTSQHVTAWTFFAYKAPKRVVNPDDDITDVYSHGEPSDAAPRPTPPMSRSDHEWHEGLPGVALPAPDGRLHTHWIVFRMPACQRLTAADVIPGRTPAVADGIIPPMCTRSIKHAWSGRLICQYVRHLRGAQLPRPTAVRLQRRRGPVLHQLRQLGKPHRQPPVVHGRFPGQCIEDPSDGDTECSCHSWYNMKYPPPLRLVRL
jgi:hypothetical protein